MWLFLESTFFFFFATNQKPRSEAFLHNIQSPSSLAPLSNSFPVQTELWSSRYVRISNTINLLDKVATRYPEQ